MVKQNRAIIFLFIISLVLAGVIVIRSGYLDSPSPASESSIVSQESMGEVLSGQRKSNGAVAVDDNKNIVQAMKMMADCLKLQSQASDNISATADSLLSYLKNEWGTYETSDQWMEWHFYNKDGAERRLRLEVSENDSGVRGRELHVFAVDKDGNSVAIEQETINSQNPSDDVINGILKDGDVFLKEKAAAAIFPKAENIFYVEKNGALDSIDVHQGEKTFHCSTFKNVKDGCRCDSSGF